MNSGDTISRQAVLDMAGLSEWFHSSDDYNDFVLALCDLPPVTPQQKVGRWIKRESNIVFGRPYIYQCSVCKAVVDNQYETKYCPNCGAGMEGME